MSDIPIIFSAPMIRALLDGRKTQTRRILKPQPAAACAGFQKVFAEPPYFEALNKSGHPFSAFPEAPGCVTPYPKIRFAIGDRLWVRETWQYAPQKYCICPQGSEPAPCDDWSNGTGCRSNRNDVIYRADNEALTRWRPSINIPRWASRITLNVSDVRVQRLQDISEDDAKAEGVEPAVSGHGPDGPIKTYRTGFVGAWNKINGNWLDNPWVVALTFTVEQRNIDGMAA